jgi:hypothetical protein
MRAAARLVVRNLWAILSTKIGRKGYRVTLVTPISTMIEIANILQTQISLQKRVAGRAAGI